MNKFKSYLDKFVEGNFTLEYKEKPIVVRKESTHVEASFSDRSRNWKNKYSKIIFDRIYNAASIVICFGIILILLLTVSHLPEFGDPLDPVNNEVSERYITEGLKETGAVNIVAGMILDYRAFDTFGESAVLFVASMCVYMLLNKDTKYNSDLAYKIDSYYAKDPIVRSIAKFIIPFVLIAGIYIVLNGHISPGGGFAGGAIMGAGLILFSSSIGSASARKYFSSKILKRITFCSLSFYCIAKGYSFFTGAHHMPTGIPLGTAGNIISSGLILPLNICVGLIVTCTMYSFYALFTKGEI